ncbi:MAG: hypothetical protein CMJ32_07745 [Phycisphaerae bacterium]|nr:hypothetical protein [Phycisphaerae bacterium]
MAVKDLMLILNSPVDLEGHSSLGMQKKDDLLAASNSIATNLTPCISRINAQYWFFRHSKSTS